MGFAFVDDINLFHTGKPLQTGEDLIPEMQQAVNAWEEEITATRGSLVPGKSYWGLLDHKWDPQTATWSLQTIDEARAHLHSKSGITGVPFFHDDYKVLSDLATDYW
jgi:hypothetical protein